MRAPDPEERIAVTGIGIVCAIGRNAGEVWRSILESRDGIRPLTGFAGERFPTDLAAQVDDSSLPSGIRAKRLSRTDRMAVVAAGEAIGQASAGGPLPLACTLVTTGTSTGGLREGEEYFFRRLKRGVRRSEVSRVVQQPTSGPSDAVARAFKLGGGVVSNATACASAGGAIGLAADFLRSRYCDAAIAGGSDALCRLTYSGFNVLQAVDPEPCRPFSSERKGITLGEGAAYLVLERWTDALARGAGILAELCGYGSSCDAHHPTAPLEDGSGAAAAMLGALGEAGVREVSYVNAHGTGTVLNDAAESRAILSAVGERTPVSSSKSYFGHTLGASGAIEAVISILALRAQIAPPTLRLRNSATDCPLDYVPDVPRPMKMSHVVSNTFGFGGSNVSIVFGLPADEIEN